MHQHSIPQQIIGSWCISMSSINGYGTFVAVGHKLSVLATKKSQLAAVFMVHY
jgi:hypothetical protein